MPAPDRRPPPPTDVTQEYVAGPSADLGATQAYTPTGRVPGIPSLPPGSILGDFRILEQIGFGAFGSVYRAEQVSKKRVVALKVMAGDGGFVARFRREVHALGRLDHPNVVKLFAAGEASGGVYLAMELLGDSLADRLDRGPLPVADALFVAAECARALRYAHERGFVHRDVKPDNLLVAADGRVKLADLGLAKAADDETALTQTGIGIGTPLYAAPEQMRDAKHADARSDLYALGGVLYHALVGRPPFPGENLLAVLSAKAKGAFPPPSVAAPGVPPAVDRVVLKLLAKLPEHRHQTADELLQELDWLGLPKVEALAR